MPPRNPLVCGDLIAERRFAYGKSAAADGDFATAADLFEQALERVPGWAVALFALAEAYASLGRVDAAAEAFRKTLALDPSDTLGAEPRLARLNGFDALDALPRAYVARLFEDYAPRFEAHLVDSLSYRGPELIVAALDAVTPGLRFRSALDLGCGTGLMGAAVRGRVARLEGVDLAPAMVARAKARGAYDAVEVGDAIERLARAEAGAFDLILAADVLTYIGDLASLFAALRPALSESGLFAFTAEAVEGETFRLLDGLRFAHSAAYIDACARTAGLEVVALREAWARHESGAEAPGLVGVARAV